MKPSAINQLFTAHKKIIYTIIQDFRTPGGSVDWKRAFNKNPDWADILKVKNNPVNRQKLYAFVNKSSRKKYKTRVKKAKSNVGARFNPSVDKIEGLHYCPNCGYHLQLLSESVKYLKSIKQS